MKTNSPTKLREGFVTEVWVVRDGKRRKFSGPHTTMTAEDVEGVREKIGASLHALSQAGRGTFQFITWKFTNTENED